MVAGNKTAALEALAVILKPLEVMPDPKLLKVLESIGFEACYYRCDGPCNTMFHSYREPSYKGLYFCRDCRAPLELSNYSHSSNIRRIRSNRTIFI
jgi:hypothetical protein